MPAVQSAFNNPQPDVDVVTYTLPITSAKKVNTQSGIFLRLTFTAGGSVDVPVRS